MAPDRDKHLVQQFLGERIVFHEPHKESEDTHIEAPEQRPHGGFIASRDQAEEPFVRAILVCRAVTGVVCQEGGFAHGNLPLSSRLNIDEWQRAAAGPASQAPQAGSSSIEATPRSHALLQLTMQMALDANGPCTCDRLIDGIALRGKLLRQAGQRDPALRNLFGDGLRYL
jgi:hypothetical protein